MEFYSRYLASDEFLAHASEDAHADVSLDTLISLCTSVLSGRVRASDDALFRRVGAGSNEIVSTTSSPELEEALEVPAPMHRVPGLRQPIPPNDYIITNAASEVEAVLASIRDQWTTPSPSVDNEWYTTLNEPVNIALFFVSEQTGLSSSCEIPRCRLWRELLRKVHHRVAIAFVHKEFTSFYDFSDAVERPLGLLVRLSKDSASHLPGVPKKDFLPLIVLAPLVVQAAVTVTCWCIKRHAKTTTTTTLPPTTVLTTPDPSIAIKSQQRKIFFLAANAYLDEVITLLGSTEASPATVTASRQRIMALIVNVATGLTKLGRLGSSVDVDKSVALALNVASVLGDTGNSWSSTRAGVTVAVNALRTELTNVLIDMLD